MNSEDVLIILPVSNSVLFPGVVLPIAIAGGPALAAAQEAVRTQRRVGLLLQTEPRADGTAEVSGAASSGVEASGAASSVSSTPGPDNLHRVGTAATIVRFITAPDGTHHLIATAKKEA